MEITQEQKEALLQYEELKIAIKDLESKAEKLKPIISPLVSSEEKLKGLHGTFEIKSRPKWTFSVEVQEQENFIETLKADEIAKGIAKNNPIVYFEYRMAKQSKEVEN